MSALIGISSLTNRVPRLLVERRIKKRFRRSLGYALNLDHPRSYCEKVQWLKLNYLEHHPDVIRSTDKFLAREFVAEAGFPEILPELLGAWDRPEDIEWESLPRQFALKLNNGSGYGYSWLVEDRDTFDIVSFVRRVRKVWARHYGFHKGEFHYARIKPRIIAEEFLGSDIVDYKLECYNGIVRMVSAERHRQTSRHMRSYFDSSFDPLKVAFVDDCPPLDRPLQRPPCFEKMIQVAETLAAGQPLVRVDLYNLDGRVCFGELTYAPASGFVRWDPLEDDFRYGDLVDLEPAREFLAARIETRSFLGPAAPPARHADLHES